MAFLIRYVFLSIMLLAPRTSNCATDTEANPPLAFIYETDNPKSFTDALNNANLSSHLHELSNVVKELLKTPNQNSDPPAAEPTVVAFGHDLNRGPKQSYWYNVLVYLMGSRYVTLAVLIINDKEIFLLDYYMGFNICAFTIHKLFYKHIQTMAADKKEYHKRLTNMVFLDYDGATAKWQDVKTNPQAGDIGIKEKYEKVSKDLSAAAEQLEKEYPELKGLKLKITPDFAQEGPSNKVNNNTHAKNAAGFIICQYLRYQISDKVVLTGFIINLKEKGVLGATILDGQINTKYKSNEKYQGNANPYNVFLQKCQSLAIFFRNNTENVEIIKTFAKEIFGEKRQISNIRLAKFGLTVSPWTTDDIWMGLKYDFYNPARTEVDKYVMNLPGVLSETEINFTYWRSTQEKGSSTWEDIKKANISVPPMPNLNTEIEKFRNIYRESFKTTWLQRHSAYLNERVGRTVRKNTLEWKGVDISWATDLPKEFPYGFLPDVSESQLFYSQANPAVDIIILIPLKDRHGKYVLGNDGNLRWKTIVGKRNRAPFKRALNGGFVDLNKDVEQVLKWIGERYPGVQNELVRDVCLLNAIKEFLEKSKDIGSLSEEEKKRMWLTFVRLVLVPKDGKVKYQKIFSAASGDTRNRPNSFVHVTAYVFVVVHHPDLEAFLDENSLLGGDDSVESAIVDVTNDMYCFANHGLFMLRAMLYRPTIPEVVRDLQAIQTLREILKQGECPLIKSNLDMLYNFAK